MSYDMVIKLITISKVKETKMMKCLRVGWQALKMSVTVIGFLSVITWAGYTVVTLLKEIVNDVIASLSIAGYSPITSLFVVGIGLAFLVFFPIMFLCEWAEVNDE